MRKHDKTAKNKEKWREKHVVRRREKEMRVLNLQGSRSDVSLNRPDGYCQISNRQGYKRLDFKPSPSERFTLNNIIQRKICKKIIFPKVIFRTRMYK